MYFSLIPGELSKVKQQKPRQKPAIRPPKCPELSEEMLLERTPAWLLSPPNIKFTRINTTRIIIPMFLLLFVAKAVQFKSIHPVIAPNTPNSEVEAPTE